VSGSKFASIFVGNIMGKKVEKVNKEFPPHPMPETPFSKTIFIHILRIKFQINKNNLNLCKFTVEKPENE